MDFEDLIEFDDDELKDKVDQADDVDTNVDETDDNSNLDSDVPDADDDIIIEPDESAVAYFEFLKEANVLDVPEDFEFDGSSDGIQEALSLTRANLENKTRQELWEALPDDFKPLLEYGLKGGQSLQDYLNTFAPRTLDEQDISDPISQKIIIAEYYKMMNPNTPEERIERLIAKKEELGTLEEEAQDALTYIKELQEERKANFIKQQEEAVKQQQLQIEEANNKLKDTIKNFNDFDQLRKNRIETLFFTPRQQTSEFDQKMNAVFANPEHLVQLADVIADYDPRIGFTFDRLKKRIKTESNRKFSDLIQDKLDSKSKVKGSVRHVVEDFDLEK